MLKKSTYTPTDKEKEAIDLVLDRMEKMKRKRQDYESDWRDAEKQRMMWLEKRTKDDWGSNLKLPDTFSVIEAAKTEMVNNSPGVSYMPRESGKALRAEKLNKIFEYTWERGNGDLELIKFVDDTLVYGLGIGEEYWRQDLVEQKVIEDFDLENFKPKSWTIKEKIEFDDVYFESIPVWSFYWDPMADSLKNCRDVCKRLTIPLIDFQRKYKKFPNTKLVSAGGNTFRPEWFKPVGNLDDLEVEVLHYYNKAEDLYLILANGVLLTKSDNPIPYAHKDFPFVSAVDILLPHSFVGMGEPKVMKALQEERNTLRNMRLDTTHLNIQKQYIVDDRLELDDEDLIAKPHGIIRGPVGSISVVPQQPNLPESYNEETIINDDIVRATGIDSRMQSVQTGGASTATEIAILKESSLKRIALKLRLLEKMALSRLARLRLANIQQFYSIPKVVEIIGSDNKIQETETFRNIGFKHPKGTYEWFTANPEDIEGEYDVIVVPGATLPVSKALEAQKRINLFDRLVGNPDIDQRELDRMLILAHDEDPDKLLTKPQPQQGGMPGGMPPEMQAMMTGQQGGQGQMPQAMPTVGVNRSPAKNTRIAPEQTLPGRVMAGGSNT